MAGLHFELVSPARLLFIAKQISNAEEDVADAKSDESRRKASENLEHLKAIQALI